MTRSLSSRCISLAAILLVAISTVTFGQNKGGGGKGGGGGGDSISLAFDFYTLDDGGGQFEPAYSQPVIDINELGWVVGQVESTATGSSYGVVWLTSGSSSQLQFLNTGTFLRVSPSDINDIGEIVGDGLSDVPDLFPIYYSSPMSEPVALPKPYPQVPCKAEAINNNGIVCGTTAIPGGGIASVLWRITQTAGGPSVFGPIILPQDGFLRTFAVDLNDCDEAGVAQVAGYVNNLRSTGGDSGATGWTVALDGANSVSLLSTSEVYASTVSNGIEVWSINNLGISCGVFSTTESSYWGKATLWDGAVAITLANPQPKRFWAENDVHIAYDINDQGMIVGEARNRGYPGALLWPSASATEAIRLEDLLPKRNSVLRKVGSATAINNQGVIVGTGLDNDYNSVNYCAIPRN